mmetsp:Transcript_20028/g.40587  ORF Transcript_20028/g.40587 Transcript_20028/m.40587 type:complete len:165 (+) Transcript_20028:2544-3038(+)
MLLPKVFRVILARSVLWSRQSQRSVAIVTAGLGVDQSSAAKTQAKRAAPQRAKAGTSITRGVKHSVDGLSQLLVSTQQGMLPFSRERSFAFCHKKRQKASGMLLREPQISSPRAKEAQTTVAETKKGTFHESQREKKGEFCRRMCGACYWCQQNDSALDTPSPV